MNRVFNIDEIKSYKNTLEKIEIIEEKLKDLLFENKRDFTIYNVLNIIY